jgi:hypothetical protein
LATISGPDLLGGIVTATLATASTVDADFAGSPRGSASYWILAAPVILAVIVAMCLFLEPHGFVEWTVTIIGSDIIGILMAFNVMLALMPRRSASAS